MAPLPCHYVPVADFTSRYDWSQVNQVSDPIAISNIRSEVDCNMIVITTEQYLTSHR